MEILKIEDNMEFYSHIDREKKKKKILKEHLSEVARASKEIIKEIPLEDKDFLAEISYIIGISHDFGKYTSFFQEYLLEGKKTGVKSHHSFISALFAAWQVQKYLEKNNLTKKVYSYLPLIAYFVVLHHHGDLGSIDTDIPTPKNLKNPPQFPYAESSMREKLRTIYEQVDDLRKEGRIKFIEKELENELKIHGKVKEFLDSWLEVLKSLVSLKQTFMYKEENRIKLFLITLLLYSTLIDADKRDAGEVSKINRKILPEDLVDKYRKTHFNLNSTRLIDCIRNEIYEKVSNKIQKVPLENHLFTLTAPTGSGKTLTAFSAALKLRTRIEKERGYSPRIIYSLPFITIIEQNYKIIRDVLSSQIKDFKENESSYLLKHHHLTDLEYKEGNESKPLDESLLLIESWQSEVIVTTFVQFLHTIIGFKNNFLKKYHNIAGSIILLDEVQNIPIEYWDIVEKVIKLLTQCFGCYFILLTATKPLIFKEEETIELLDDNQRYFRDLNRVIIKSDVKEEKTIDEFIDWFKEFYDPQKSYLIVANTIRSSIEIYRKIKDYKLNNLLFYLSTNIVPYQRAERVKRIKELLKKGNRPIVVSTQVIEAGVDLDFDVVIRDIGPIDSIIQASGRCNRENEKQKSVVYILSLNHFASSVYGKIHPYISKRLLGSQEIEEKEFYKLTKDYFEQVKSKINDDISKYIWRAMNELRFYEKEPPQHNGYKILVSEFQLIKERGEYVDIFVELNDEAKQVWKKYCEKVYSEKDFFKRRESYLSIRKKFRNYIISVQKKRDLLLPPEVCGLRYIQSGEPLKTFYSIETGFKTDTDALIF